ncbi:MAG TPA: MarR family transcriptional regulator [Deltaproteobacteria bacterium]|jgi:DNA-binding MarR family transcriptional regulator|nr:MarR family transcriptional regulator [Deltaproteobacteria bacterium]
MGHSSELPGYSGEHDLTELALRAMMRSLRFVRQIMEPFFEELKISLSQWVMMRVVLDRENETGKPVRLIDLCTLLMIRQPTLTAMINKLVLLGLVERVSAEDDRRARYVRLSQEGRSLIDKAVEVHRVNISALFNVWSDKDKENALELFTRLENHLMKYIASDSKTRRCEFGLEGKAVRGEL